MKMIASFCASPAPSQIIASGTQLIEGSGRRKLMIGLMVACSRGTAPWRSQAVRRRARRSGSRAGIRNTRTRECGPAASAAPSRVGHSTHASRNVFHGVSSAGRVHERALARRTSRALLDARITSTVIVSPVTGSGTSTTSRRSRRPRDVRPLLEKTGSVSAHQTTSRVEDADHATVDERLRLRDPGRELVTRRTLEPVHARPVPEGGHLVAPAAQLRWSSSLATSWACPNMRSSDSIAFCSLPRHPLEVAHAPSRHRAHPPACRPRATTIIQQLLRVIGLHHLHGLEVRLEEPLRALRIGVDPLRARRRCTSGPVIIRNCL